MTTSILIIGQEGRLRDGLRAILLAHQEITEVSAVSNFARALELITPAYPSLIIIDSSDTIGDEIMSLEQFLARLSRKQCIVITNSLEQQTKALNAGAYTVLMQGFSTNKLYDTLEELISATEIRNSQLTKGKDPMPVRSAQQTQTFV